MELPPQVFDPAELIPAGTPNPDLAACVEAWHLMTHFHGYVIRDAVTELIGITYDTSLA